MQCDPRVVVDIGWLIGRLPAGHRPAALGANSHLGLAPQIEVMFSKSRLARNVPHQIKQFCMIWDVVYTITNQE